MRLGGLSDGQPTLAALVFFLNLNAGLLMKFPHETCDIATTIVAEQLLVKQTVLLVVIKLKSAALFSTEHTSQRLIDKSLRPNGQVLF